VDFNQPNVGILDIVFLWGVVTSGLPCRM
jgi:hypothetical protein